MATYRTYDSATITGTLPANDEPRHDEDGTSVVGAVDLRTSIDATTTKTADAAWREGDLTTLQDLGDGAAQCPHVWLTAIL